MITKLEWTNAFTLQSGSLDFQTGHTSITGKNGYGKSLILELIQYGLWGSQALRGKAPDYKKMTATLYFEIKGEAYKVYRSSNDAVLSLQGVDIARGTTPVNAKIKSLLGFDFEVFQISNCIAQGEVEKLSQMRPTERKRMVDNTVGLNALDGLEKWVGEQALAFSKLAQGIQSVLVEPVAPVPIDGEQDLEKLQADRARFTELMVERKSLMSVAFQAVQQPVWPMKPDCTLKVSEMTALMSKRAELAGQLMATKVEFDGIAVPTMPLDLIQRENEMAERAVKLNEITAELQKIVAPEVTLDLIEQDRQVEKTKWLSDRKAKLLASLAKYTCPACDHHWHAPSPELEEYANVPDQCPDPLWTEAYRKAQERLIALAERKPELQAKLDELLVGWVPPTTTRQERETQARLHNLAGRRSELETKLTELGTEFAGMVDYAADIAAVRAYETALVEAHHLQEKWDEVQAAQKKLQDPKFENIDELERELQAQINKVLVFQAEKGRYEGDLVVYQENVNKLDELKRKEDGFRAARKSIADLRNAVKSFLLPSLNKVSSLFLHEMTGGDLREVSIDDNFEIQIDGKSVEVLSGAGKAVANLAPRLALGTILTGRVFPSVLLDEIDGACDDQRATYVAKCIARLASGTFKQVIQVSHKAIEAEHTVRLPLCRTQEKSQEGT